MRADKVGQHRTAYDKNRQIILKTQHVCGICGNEVDFRFSYPHPLSPTVDHIIPISKGGHPSDISNLQLAHRWCNRQKSDKILIESNKQKAKNEIKSDDLPLHFDWVNYRSR